MVKFSPAAIAELHRWSQAQGDGASSDGVWTVTLQKILGGCRQWSYDLQLSSQDSQQDTDGAIALDEKIQLRVAGSDPSWCENLTVDYSEDLVGGGFRFVNPSATEICSCSASFDLA